MVLEDYDLEIDWTLITSLYLEDLSTIEASRKNKGRADAPLSDEQLALRAQADDLKDLLNTLDNYRFAKSFDEALEADHEFLRTHSVVAQAEEDDHRVAIALSQGLPLPPPSQSQRALERLQPQVVSVEVQDVVRPSRMNHRPEGSRTSIEVTPRSDAISKRRLQHECAVCFNIFNASTMIQAPCGHHYCRGCLSALAEASLRDETLFPPRCCKQQFATEVVIPHLKASLVSAFHSRVIEFETPPDDRIYCPRSTCSAFLGRSDHSSRELICAKCHTAVCSSCKNAAHRGEACAENASTIAVKELARSMRWATCPGCHRIIELTQGCYHMVCRCRTQFCYLCAVPWKNCSCPQWDESRLYNAAEQRVADELEMRPVAARPAAFNMWNTIQERMAELRVRHECINHNWRYRHGGGTCTECRRHLPVFLMMCVNCSMLACVRCTRNRL